MLFHTFLAHVVAKAQKRPIRVLSAKSLMSRYNNRDGVITSGPGITGVTNVVESGRTTANGGLIR